MDAKEQTREIGSLLRNLALGKETTFELVDALEGDGNRLEVAYRQLPPALPDEPPVARALARMHEFHSIDTFAGYLGPKTLALADVDSMTIGAVLDESTEGDREQILFRAKIHPTFAPWHALLDKATPVIEFAIHCMKFRRTVIEPDGMELAHVMSQVKASKATTRMTGIGKKSINGVMVELEVSGERRGVPVELPEMITIETPLYIGTSPVQVEIDLLVTEASDRIVVFCTSTQFEEAKVAAFGQFVDRLAEDGNGTVGFGKVQHRPWREVGE